MVKKIIRLYRAEGKGDSKEGVPAPSWVKQTLEYQRNVEASGRWFTDDLKEAEWYIKNEYPSGKILFVDVPKEIANHYRVSQLKKTGGKLIGENPFAFSRRPEKEYFLPREIANQKRDYTKGVWGRKNLAMKFSILFISGGIILGINSLTATGNIVLNLTKTTSGLLGILFFIVGLVGFLLLKK